jgi:hypothetical protein
MKKLLLAALLFSGSLQAQTKDTTVQITLTLNQLRAVFAVLDQNIDSKKVSKEVLEFLQANAKIVNPVTDWNKKAQEATKQIDNKPKN